LEHHAITDRTPFSRMLPSVIGVIGGCMGRDYHQQGLSAAR
jgi:hypothetical protein